MRTITESFIGPRYRVYATMPEPASRSGRLISIISALFIPLIWFVPLPQAQETAGTAAVGTDARLTLLIFAVAVWMWVFSAVSDTFVALSAASVLANNAGVGIFEVLEELTVADFRVTFGIDELGATRLAASSSPTAA